MRNKLHLAGVLALPILFLAVQTEVAYGKGGGSSAPAPRASSAPRGGGGSSGGGFGGGAGGGARPAAAPHIPGNMAAPHVPGAAAPGAGGAHLPSSVAPHVPSSAQPARSPVAPHPTAPTERVSAPERRFQAPGRPTEGRPTEGRGPEGRPTELHPESAAASLRGRDAPALRPGTVLRQTRDLRPPARDIEHDRQTLQAHEHDFHVRDVHRFNEHEFDRWRGGHWGHDWHYGRYGWWYDVDGVSYPYEAPLFPYPVEVSVPVVAEIDHREELVGTAVERPAGVIGEVAVPVSTETTEAGGGVVAPVEPAPQYMIVLLPAAPPVTYHCPSAGADYPDLHVCASVWTAVPIAQ